MSRVEGKKKKSQISFGKSLWKSFEKSKRHAGKIQVIESLPACTLVLCSFALGREQQHTLLDAFGAFFHGGDLC